ncbi:hypothetical protein EYZ11_007144 [Aspergillus tanneri]|uniref:TauD/TfdA-like domain-containing protein n=1 Tax=Aspergillus tanneri TaxID=1220188 RepID=A0A4S3JFZ7_9EURO|nr:uncharacterized protein ATNIH1004_010663 [Aspergillus tanneri]KAA8641724.1 hypothetical protein ATNIH1004_010663 [Aspergillus tanneri]THC93387.1 hypothetical protein EYZ11_007144 [Aspergillus tanneri]
MGSIGQTAKRQPLELRGHLKKFKSFNCTPVLGTEFPDAKLAEWLQAPNADDLIRDLAITVSQRGVVVFRSQTDLTDELQKTLVQKLGELTGKPSDSSWHIHPLAKYSATGDKTRHLITTDPSKKPAEDRFNNQAQQPMGVRAAWHTDISYEPNPADYSMLKMIQLPERGGDTLYASSYEILDKISPAYRGFLETLTATFAQPRYRQSSEEKKCEIHLEPRGSPKNIGSDLSAVHPVVRTNPVTGWKSLYGAGMHTQRINEVTTEESRRLLDWLLQMVVENHDLQFRHNWKNPYDVAIWDNRSVFHAGIMDYKGQGPRTGHRYVGVGEEPYLDPESKTRREALGDFS